MGLGPATCQSSLSGYSPFTIFFYFPRNLETHLYPNAPGSCLPFQITIQSLSPLRTLKGPCSTPELQALFSHKKPPDSHSPALRNYITYLFPHMPLNPCPCPRDSHIGGTFSARDLSIGCSCLPGDI